MADNFSENYLLTGGGVVFFFNKETENKIENNEFKLSFFGETKAISWNNKHAILTDEIVDYLIMMSNKNQKIILFFAERSEDSYRIKCEKYIALDIQNLIAIASQFKKF